MKYLVKDLEQILNAKKINIVEKQGNHWYRNR